MEQDIHTAFNLLKEQNQGLVEETVVLKETVTVLEKSNAKLIEENNQLKEKLGLNSTNSSLPPSRDLYKIKKQKDRRKSDRKPGGQPGHPGRTYQPLSPDQTIDCISEQCICGSSQVEKTEQFFEEQKIEIPPIKPQVTNYRRWKVKCKACQQTTFSPLPDEVQTDLLGPHAKAIIGALNGFYHNSKRDVQAILSQIFNLDISLGLVATTAKRVNVGLEAHYEALKGKNKQSDYLHIDETGHKNKGKRGWSWVFTNHTTSLIHLASSRGQKVLSDVLGEYRGNVISDRYGAYNYFSQDQRQLFWSHLLRDFKRFSESLQVDLSHKGHRLVTIAREIFALVANSKKLQISKKVLYRRLKKLSKEMQWLLKSITKIPDRPQAQRVGRNLLKSFRMMWRFVEKPFIDMTNNLAERQLRKYVTYRKKLLFTWSDWGEEYVERMLSMFLTCRLNKTNPFLQLTQFMA